VRKLRRLFSLVDHPGTGDSSVFQLTNSAFSVLRMTDVPKHTRRFFHQSTVLTCLIGSIECFLVGICLSHYKAEWALKWDLQLLTIIFSVSITSHETPCQQLKQT
jgi:hypothetical protein